MTTTIPQGLLLLAEYTDLLTCGSLIYKTTKSEDSRALAAARLLNSDAIVATDTEGHYKVKSDNMHKPDGSPVYFDVLVDGTESSCVCEDYHIRGKTTEPPLVCKHQIAVTMYVAIKNVLG